MFFEMSTGFLDMRIFPINISHFYMAEFDVCEHIPDTRYKIVISCWV